jgi:cation diffusion facilitator family transporter
MKLKNRTQYIYLEGWTSISVNFVLFIFKYWVGIISGSVALIADAWHTISDSMSSVIVLIGNKITTKPADKMHPFGHGRAEIISGIIIGMILGFIAFEFLLESLARLRNRIAAPYGIMAIIVTAMAVIIKEGLAQFAFRIGKKVNSTVLIADAWHHRSDAISSLLILIGIFLGEYFWWIDGFLGIIVSVLIFYATYEILRDAINPLLGEQPTDSLMNRIRSICEDVLHFESDIHHFHIHRYGDHKELTFHMRMPPDMTIEEAHNIVNQIEAKIRIELNIEATIHMEPIYPRSM